MIALSNVPDKLLYIGLPIYCKANGTIVYGKITNLIMYYQPNLAKNLLSVNGIWETEWEFDAYKMFLNYIYTNKKILIKKNYANKALI